MDEEQSSRGDGFVLVRLERLKLEYLGHGAQTLKFQWESSLCCDTTESPSVNIWLTLQTDEPGQVGVNETLSEPIRG